MALILSLETSARSCSVAIHRGGILLAEQVAEEPQAHATKLSALINECLVKAESGFQDLQAVAVSSGPGSYTGLRIGVSTAKGICLALNIPLIALPTLQILTSAASTLTGYKDYWFCPLIDARRMEVYYQLFNLDRHPVGAINAAVVDEHFLNELLPARKVLFFGDPAEKIRPVIEKPGFAVLKEEFVPKASMMGELSFRKFEANAFEELSEFVPLYLKEFVAKKAASFF